MPAGGLPEVPADFMKKHIVSRNDAKTQGPLRIPIESDLAKNGILLNNGFMK